MGAYWQYMASYHYILITRYLVTCLNFSWTNVKPYQFIHQDNNNCVNVNKSIATITHAFVFYNHHTSVFALKECHTISVTCTHNLNSVGTLVLDPLTISYIRSISSTKTIKSIFRRRKRYITRSHETAHLNKMSANEQRSGDYLQITVAPLTNMVKLWSQHG